MLRGRFSFLGLAALASLLLFSYSLIADSRSLPELKTHPLPANLAQWQEQNQSGDYFDAVEISPVGALIWSQFPVKIYVHSDRSSWLSLVQQAIAEWGQYLPMELV
ncbi:MAG: peptidase, partial [Microcystis sp. M53600_WE12]|nr:peptidase [Microcystis sp. M53600_WE12]